MNHSCSTDGDNRHCADPTPDDIADDSPTNDGLPESVIVSRGREEISQGDLSRGSRVLSGEGQESEADQYSEFADDDDISGSTGRSIDGRGGNEGGEKESEEQHGKPRENGDDVDAGGDGVSINSGYRSESFQGEEDAVRTTVH